MVNCINKTDTFCFFFFCSALGFRRAAPVVGRRVNVTSEIEEICDEELKETFFISPDNKKCFHGVNCSQYCNVMHPLCGEPDLIEVAMIAFMPFYKKGDEKVCLINSRSLKNPFQVLYIEYRGSFPTFTFQSSDSYIGWKG